MKLTEIIQRLSEVVSELSNQLVTYGDLQLDNNTETRCLAALDEVYVAVRGAEQASVEQPKIPSMTFADWVSWANENNAWFQLATYLHERPSLFYKTPIVEQAAQEQGQPVEHVKPAPAGDVSGIPVVCCGKLPENKPEDKAQVKDLPKGVADQIRLDARVETRELVKGINEYARKIGAYLYVLQRVDGTTTSRLDPWRARLQGIYVLLRETEAQLTRSDEGL